MRSEVYPSLRSEIRVVRASEAAEAPGAGVSRGSLASGGLAPFRSMSSAVDEFVPFPALKAAGVSTHSRGSQAGGGYGRLPGSGGFRPGPVLGRFQADSLGVDEGDSDDQDGGFVGLSEGGLRRRSHATFTATQPQPAAGSLGALPPLARPAAPAGLDGFSAVSGGSAVSGLGLLCCCCAGGCRLLQPASGQPPGCRPTEQAPTQAQRGVAPCACVPTFYLLALRANGSRSPARLFCRARPAAPAAAAASSALGRRRCMCSAAACLACCR